RHGLPTTRAPGTTTHGTGRSLTSRGLPTGRRDLDLREPPGAGAMDMLREWWLRISTVVSVTVQRYTTADQGEPRGEPGARRRPRDHHLAGLKRLPQRVQHVPAELRRLVQEEYAAVRQARGARPDDPAAAADDGGLARGVVRGAERRLG